jgi:hypothetical protein
MGSLLQTLAIVTIGIALLCFGYSLFAKQFAGIRFAQGRNRQKKRHKTGQPGQPQVCPVCSAILNKGELVSSRAYPSLSGGRDRLMHIRGCYYCLNGNSIRRCPVCGVSLRTNDYLIARMFERPQHRNHVHVLGCSHCKKYKA